LATGKSRPYPLSIVIDDLTSSPSTRRRARPGRVRPTTPRECRSRVAHCVATLRAFLRRGRPGYGRHPSRGPLAENVRVFRSPSCSFASSAAPRSRSSSSVSGFRRS